MIYTLPIIGSKNLDFAASLNLLTEGLELELCPLAQRFPLVRLTRFLNLAIFTNTQTKDKNLDLNNSF